ncbi:MAG: hypothetical protein AB7G93_10815 [Bdellovibrionales bacterium]
MLVVQHLSKLVRTCLIAGVSLNVLILSASAFAAPERGGNRQRNGWLQRYETQCAYFHQRYPHCRDYRPTARDIEDFRNSGKAVRGENYWVKVCAWQYEADFNAPWNLSCRRFFWETSPNNPENQNRSDIDSDETEFVEPYGQDYDWQEVGAG